MRRGVHVRLAGGLVSLEPRTRAHFSMSSRGPSSVPNAVPRVRLDSGALRIALKPWFDADGKLKVTSRLGRTGASMATSEASGPGVRHHSTPSTTGTLWTIPPPEPNGPCAA